jgi:hypothetical protein
MRLSILVWSFLLSFLFVVSSLAVVSAYSSNAVVTTTTTTTTSSTKLLVFKGHSPVDLEVCYNSDTVVNACTTPNQFNLGTAKHPHIVNAIVGCVAEPCTRGFPSSNAVYLALFSEYPASIATFNGPSGTGCDTESSSFTETITVYNPQPGTYTLQLFPSATFFASTGTGCPHTTTATSFSYTITVTDSNTQTMTGQIGGYSTNMVSSNTGPLTPDGTITIFTTIPTPVFPLGAILAVIVPLLALATYFVVATHLPRKSPVLAKP